VRSYGLAMLLLTAQSALADCPAFVFGKDLPNRTAGDLRVFAYQSSAFMELPIQVDRLQNGELVTAPSEPSLEDRIVIGTDGWGSKWSGEGKFPCQARWVQELSDSKSRFAYLGLCEPEARKAFDHPVIAQPGRYVSPLYNYQYWPKNQLLYQALELRHPQTGEILLGGKDAEFSMHLDLKGFPNFDFDKNDLESYVKTSNAGELGVATSIDFFLRFMFFKINLKMATLAAFYGDSANIPMVVDVPVKAPRFLNPGSGLLFSWDMQSARIDFSHPETRFPSVAPSAIKAGGEPFRQVGLSYCTDPRSDLCTFRFLGLIRDLPFVMDIYVPRIMVENNFFPIWIGDPDEFRKELGWRQAPASPDVGGIYFENSGLPKGTYKLDYWIKVSKDANRCPMAINLRRVLPGP
jgi:hypothetical protein